uniref:Uncharacterized protein n=1 Tax=Kalanchoe fedtschenkoi TaxID=63787 RepID=A0A7N0TDR7_KALFE
MNQRLHASFFWVWKTGDINNWEEQSKDRRGSQYDATRYQKGSMDRTRRLSAGKCCRLIWRPPMGFCSKSFRFEGGGRQVLGLNRTGKSCRLRWLNYLHPGLKRGKMTSTEERIVLELHARWGNRWSRIARRLPGRTDNEIKNYWRTHMRKKAQERKRVNYLSITSSESYSSSSNHTQDSLSCSGKESFYDTGGLAAIAVTGKKQKEEEGERIKMDEIWNDIDISKDTITPLNDSYNQGLCTYSCAPLVSPIWEYCPDPLWRMDEDDSKMPPPSNDYFQTCCEAGTSTLKGP